MNRFFLSVTFILYTVSIATVFTTAYVSGYDWVLGAMTKENGAFESLTVVLLFTLCFLSLKYSLAQNKILKLALILFATVAFVAGMEEISWGQQLLRFESSEFFKQNNLQHETNLHNLVKGGLFSSVIYSTVYTGFIFGPILFRLLSSKNSFFSKYAALMPPYHVSLIALFASSFQVYFYNNFSAIFDFATLMAGLVFFGIGVSILKAWDRLLVFHYQFIICSVVFFASSYKIFNFFNSQYEIREMFVVLATVLYLISLFDKTRYLKN